MEGTMQPSLVDQRRLREAVAEIFRHVVEEGAKGWGGARALGLGLGGAARGCGG
ncbi:unnamed protein product [Prunus armeniaca]|uniref:Uncharacterized protein n=1 Tax=Prunus armeniaca TaxID=36596 RepID=A0A6J5UWH3_PRUAR|nr:unnamed protein product [Prunus armeniaca]CAB4310765.1 unnamed protein product [Prunus armeniaca]